MILHYWVYCMSLLQTFSIVSGVKDWGWAQDWRLSSSLKIFESIWSIGGIWFMWFRWFFVPCQSDPISSWSMFALVFFLLLIETFPFAVHVPCQIQLQTGFGFPIPTPACSDNVSKFQTGDDPVSTFCFFIFFYLSFVEATCSSVLVWTYLAYSCCLCLTSSMPTWIIFEL